MNYTQQVVVKYRKGKDGKKRAAQLKEAREEQRLRKTVIPVEAAGLKAAIHEWARALLGLPRQSSAPSPSSSSSSSSTLTKHLETHLPLAASEAEVEAWTRHSTRRSNFINDSVKKEMTRLLLSNPRATDAAKHELKKNVTKRTVEAYEKSHPAVRFQSSVAKATASVVTYDSSRLSYAEAALSQSGFPRLTFQWGNALSSSWNQATINSLVASWLDCYNARGVPASYIIDESLLEVPRLAKEILTTWVQHKRQLYSTQSKEKILISQAGGAAKLEKKLMSVKDKRSMSTLRKTVRPISNLSHFWLVGVQTNIMTFQICANRQRAIEPYVKGFNATTRYFLSDPRVHSETEMVKATATTPAGLRRLKLAWRADDLDELIVLADLVYPKTITDKVRRKREEEKQASRSVYSSEKVPAEDQTPPVGFPRALVKEKYLMEELDEIVVDGLALSDESVDLKALIEILKKKLSKGITMNTS